MNAILMNSFLQGAPYVGGGTSPSPIRRIGLKNRNPIRIFGGEATEKFFKLRGVSFGPIRILGSSTPSLPMYWMPPPKRHFYDFSYFFNFHQNNLQGFFLCEESIVLISEPVEQFSDSVLVYFRFALFPD
jgi:hypothetical protein